MLIIPTHFHCSSSCIHVKSQILDFGSKVVNFSTTCSSCLACSGGLRAKGTQERGQTHTCKHNSICYFIWGGPQAGVTWSRTNCAKLALETHKNKKSTILPFPPPTTDFALQMTFWCNKGPSHLWTLSHNDRFAYSSKTVLPCAENRRRDVIFLNRD